MQLGWGKQNIKLKKYVLKDCYQILFKMAVKNAEIWFTVHYFSFWQTKYQVLK